MTDTGDPTEPTEPTPTTTSTTTSTTAEAPPAELAATRRGALTVAWWWLALGALGFLLLGSLLTFVGTKASDDGGHGFARDGHGHQQYGPPGPGGQGQMPPGGPGQMMPPGGPGPGGPGSGGGYGYGPPEQGPQQGQDGRQGDDGRQDDGSPSTTDTTDRTN